MIFAQCTQMHNFVWFGQVTCLKIIALVRFLSLFRKYQNRGRGAEWLTGFPCLSPEHLSAWFELPSCWMLLSISDKWLIDYKALHRRVKFCLVAVAAASVTVRLMRFNCLHKTHTPTVLPLTSSLALSLSHTHTQEGMQANFEPHTHATCLLAC